MFKCKNEVTNLWAELEKTQNDLRSLTPFTKWDAIILVAEIYDYIHSEVASPNLCESRVIVFHHSAKSNLNTRLWPIPVLKHSALIK